MMGQRLLATILVAASLSSALAATPFRLPIGAKMSGSQIEVGGWLGTGTIEAPLVQARARLMSSVVAADWRFLHEIAIEEWNERLLITFVRGNQELTLMVWRMDVDKSGFSYGISKRGK